MDDMIKEYMSTQINVGDDFGWERQHPLRQSLERYRHEKFSQTQWNKIYQTWYRQFRNAYFDNSETSMPDDYLQNTSEGKKFLVKVHRWIEKNREYVFNI